MTTNNTPIPTLTEAYAARTPNELEKRLAAQKKPGYIPSGGMGTYALDTVMRGLKITDPAKHLRIKAAQVNGEGDDVIRAILRGEA